MMKVQLNKQQLKGIGFIFLSTLIYSIMPVIIRFLDKSDVPSSSQVFLRYIFAFLSAFVFFKLTNKKLDLSKGNIFLLVLVSILGYGLTNLIFSTSVLLTLASNALFLFYTFAIITPVLGFLVLKERINKFNVVSLVIAIIALVFLFQPNSISTWKIGGALAFLSAITQAFYLIGRKKLMQYDSATMLLCNTFLGMIAVGVISILTESEFYISQDVFNLSANVWFGIIIFGVMNFLAWFFMSKGFETIKSTTGSIIMLAENVFSVTFVIIFLNELPTIYTLIGGILIVISAVIVTLKGDNS